MTDENKETQDIIQKLHDEISRLEGVVNEQSDTIDNLERDYELAGEEVEKVEEQYNKLLGVVNEFKDALRYNNL